MKRRLSAIDASFIHMERRESPQHASVFLVFSPPADAGEGYLERLVEHMRSFPVEASPFNYRLSQSRLDRLAPAWTILPPDEIDIDYHLRHSALPRPGGELELGVLVSRLVSQPVDLGRPPWEVYVIEGMLDGRFALLVKMHHSLMDGMSAIRMLRTWLSDDPAREATPPLWAMPASPTADETPSRSADDRRAGAVRAGTGGIRSSLASTGRALAAVSRRGSDELDGWIGPHSAPRTSLNGTVTARRRISTQSLDLERVRRVATAIDGTVNDAITVVLGGAMRRYLLELDALPEESLVAGVLASLRSASGAEVEGGGGNVIGFLFADLGTDTDDVGDRARRVVRSIGAAKQRYDGLGSAAMAYNTVSLIPWLASTAVGRGHRLPPIYNIALSNVPGSTVPLYLDGARAESLHGTTVIASGHTLILAVTSWGDKLDFTLTSCPDATPHPQRIVVYLPDALAEAETALEITS